MTQLEVVLAAFSSIPGADYSPVQAQKFLFLLDRNIAGHIGGPVFQFEPYDYGPFDQAVYQTLDQLALAGDVEIAEVPGRHWKKYRLTATGQNSGTQVMEQLNPQVQQYIRNVSEFVRSLSFSQLVSAIYRDYPEMKANSVFNQ